MEKHQPTKIRNLKRRSAETIVSVWPPQEAVVSVWPPKWGGSYGAGDKFVIGEGGVLVSVKRLGDRLSLTIKHEGREHSGSLQWDAPPSLDEVEKVLTAHLGEPIRDIGDLEV